MIGQMKENCLDPHSAAITAEFVSSPGRHYHFKAFAAQTVWGWRRSNGVPIRPPGSCLCYRADVFYHCAFLFCTIYHEGLLQIFLLLFLFEKINKREPQHSSGDKLKLFFGPHRVFICGFSAPKHICSYHWRILFFFMTHTVGLCVVRHQFFFFLLTFPATV